MALMKYLVKDLIINDETRELADSGTKILAKGHWLTRDTRNNLMTQYGFSTDGIPDDYVMTVVDKIASFLKENPEDTDYARAGPLGDAYKFSEASGTVKGIRGL